MTLTTVWKAASTIILVARSSGRVLLMRRGQTAKFMPGSFCFPGGVAEEKDELLGEATKVAALRELFEETGILPLKDRLLLASENEELMETRREVVKDAGVFGKLVTAASLPLSSLYPWSVWLTPTYHKQRYMTTFFVLPIDNEPEVSVCEREMSECVWVSPGSALSMAKAGNLQLPPPQVYEMTRLAQVPLDSLSKYENKHVICPQQVLWGNGMVSNILPGDHLYVNEDCYQQPTRKMKEEEVQVSTSLPTHRLVFSQKPLWGNCEIHLHNLPANLGFHQFNVKGDSKL